MSLWLSTLLLVLGTLLNAFCSGMETAFFRVAKLRLLLDAKQGGFWAKARLWLCRRPSLVVASLLVGVNLANFVISYAIVKISDRLFAGSYGTEVAISILLTPLLFIYADLLPKSVAFAAPYGMMQRWTPVLFVLIALLFPLSALLWALSQLLTAVLGESPQTTQENLARKELTKVFDEGQAVGILRPAQRRIAQEIVTAGQRRVSNSVVLAHRLPRVAMDAPKVDALRAAAMRKCPHILVEDTLPGKPLLGYVTVLDIKLREGNELPPIRPLLQLSSEETHITALHKMFSKGERIAKVVGRGGAVLGFVLSDRLANELNDAEWSTL